MLLDIGTVSAIVDSEDDAKARLCKNRTSGIELNAKIGQSLNLHPRLLDYDDQT